MRKSDINLLAELCSDFESSDAMSRYNYIPDDAIYAESLNDDEVFDNISADFESCDHHSRYDYIDELEPFSMEGSAEPEIVFDFSCTSGEDYYIFEAKPQETKIHKHA